MFRYILPISDIWNTGKPWIDIEIDQLIGWNPVIFRFYFLHFIVYQRHFRHFYPKISVLIGGKKPISNTGLCIGGTTLEKYSISILCFNYALVNLVGVMSSRWYDSYDVNRVSCSIKTIRKKIKISTDRYWIQRYFAPEGELWFFAILMLNNSILSTHFILFVPWNNLD